MLPTELTLSAGFRHLGSVFLVVMLAIAGIGCGGGGTGNEMETGPSVENAIQDQNANAGGEAIEIDLQPVFSAPSASSLGYSASSSDEAVVTVEISGTTLSVSPQEGGEAQVTVTARTDAGEATDRFTVSVFADPPGRPSAE